jgi:hypothetical protein
MKMSSHFLFNINGTIRKNNNKLAVVGGGTGLKKFRCVYSSGIQKNRQSQSDVDGGKKKRETIPQLSCLIVRRQSWSKKKNCCCWIIILRSAQQIVIHHFQCTAQNKRGRERVNARVCEYVRQWEVPNFEYFNCKVISRSERCCTHETWLASTWS